MIREGPSGPSLLFAWMAANMLSPCITLLCSLLLSASPSAPSPQRVEGLRSYVLQPIAVPAGLPERTNIALAIDGRTETLRLFRTSMRSPTAKLLLDKGSGKLEEAPLPPAHTYRGTVASSGARVAATIIDGKLWAMIDGADGTVFVQPASELLAARGVTEHVVYRHSDTVPAGDHHCGNDEIKLAEPDWMHGVPTDPLAAGSSGVRHGGVAGGGVAGGEGDGGEGDGGVAGTSPFVAEIAFDADYEFFVQNGSLPSSTVLDIETVMNNVSLVYDRDANISYEYTTFVVRTTAADPYTSTDMNTQLCEFRTQWNAAPENQIQRDVAQLFTGKSMNGSVIGLAWLGVVCNQSGTACTTAGNLAYSCVESRFTTIADYRTGLSAHEIGHNWQAQHCDAGNPCNIMCSVINGCQGTTGANLKFSTSEQAQIINYRNTVSCDAALPPPIALPFVDGFDASIAVNTNNWTYVKGAVVTTAAVGEPSPTRSLNLDALGALEYSDDEVRSNFMLLGGLATATASYATEHIGVEAGKQLAVEYLNASLEWAPLNTITSNGINQSGFQQWSHTLPADALHNKFRLRFRAAVDAQDDDWYIDDVRVVTVVIPANDECSAAPIVGEGAHVFDSTTATDSATALPASCDEGAGTAMKNDLWYLYVPTCSGNATASTCGTAAFDTRLSAYRLTCPPTGSLIACSDNASGCTAGTSSMTFPVAAGAGVLIRVGGATTGGFGVLNLSCVAVAPCDADLNSDHVVNSTDLSEILNAWDTPNADINGDGNTDSADLALLLNAWGACP